MGAFVTIAANGQDALRAIDADQLVLAASFSGSRLRIFDSAGTQVADLPLGRDHPAPRTIPRAALSGILREEAMRRGVRIEYGKQFTTAEASGAGVRTFFADGSYADADLLIGSDAIHSPVRTLIDLDAPAPRYTGLIIACGYADNPTVTTPEAGSYDMIHGGRAFFGTLPAPTGAAGGSPASPAPSWRLLIWTCLRLNGETGLPTRLRPAARLRRN
jgi:FAD-dependent urate hydroxylase